MKTSEHRPTQILVHLPVISSNFQQVMKKLPTGTKGFAVVKANAYGHGSVAVARELAPHADGFCVSNIDEALELRQVGISHPVLVLGVVPVSSIPIAVKEKISITVASLEWYQAAVEAYSLSDLLVHIKVDTGMGRLGFRDSVLINDVIESLMENGAIVEGIFTHFATADTVDTVQFEEQLQRFQQVLSQLSYCPPLIHASNSATSIWHKDSVFSMVRLGNILYGLNPSGHELVLPERIQPAMELHSELVHVKVLPAGAAIGYGATYHCEKNESIGTVPIGYADGFLRQMQGFSVLVDGQWCEVVGRVSMDQITIRLPKSYPLGTRVTLIGHNGEKELTVQDWADYQSTINYEVVCLLSDRIARWYL